MKFILLYLLSLILFNSRSRHREKNTEDTIIRPYVVMLSLDGFRWDYTTKAETTSLDSIAKIGVKADYLKPCFPTKTFPNHYSIATGLYPDKHGLVNNTFHDEKLDKWYKIPDREAVQNPEFYGGEPIWVSAEKQGIITASYFWPGSEASIKGILPTYTKSYDHHFPYKQRMDSVIMWLNKPYNERPHLITLYFDQPDSDGHKYGPDSPQITKQITKLDKHIGYFLQEMRKLNCSDSINFIIVSDHGMGATNPARTISLEEHIKLDWCKDIAGSNPFYNIKAKDGYYDSIYHNLKNTLHLKIWKNDEIPDKYHYGENSRCLDFTIVADSSWSIVKKGKLKYAGGTHGYSNTNSDMWGIFYAFGPAFKPDYKAKGFENTNIYLLISNLLGISPASTDGNKVHFNEMLTKQSY